MNVHDVELALTPISRRTIGFIADQPGAARELQNHMEPAQAGLLGAPADMRVAGQVNEISPVTKGQCPVPFTLARPDVVRVIGGFIVMALSDSVFARTVSREQQIGIC